jgi:Domain found in Dishevelled, Egl-10, and Pleckstrin (DEP)
MKAVEGTVILAQSDHYQDMLIGTALHSMNLAVRKVKKDLPLLHEIKAIRETTRGPVLVCADLSRLAHERMLWPQFTGALHSIVGDIGLLATQSKLIRVSPLARGWAMKHGAIDLIGRVSHLRESSSMRPLMHAMSDFFSIEPDPARIHDFIGGMHGSIDETTDQMFADQKTWQRLESIGQQPERIVDAMLDSGKVVSKDRRYRFKTYPNCFLGNEATAWIAGHLSISEAQAEDVGKLLMGLGCLYHVVKDQPFVNDAFFYRFSRPSPALELIDLDLVMHESREQRGFDVQDRSWRGMRFPKSFIGSEAAQWLSSFYGLSSEDAIGLGQLLQDIGHFQHVTDQHGFIDHEFYYRMTLDS